MNKVVSILSACLLISRSMEASQQPKIHRTFSSCPQRDVLKNALSEANIPLLKTILPASLPTGLHAQYSYLGLTSDQSVKTLLLQAIYSYWLDMSMQDSQRALSSLLFGLKPLTREYGQALDNDFIAMLLRLKKTVAALPALEQLDGQKLAQQLQDFLEDIQVMTSEDPSEQTDTESAGARPLIHAAWPLATTAPLSFKP
jgi:hypothetical protein